MHLLDLKLAENDGFELTLSDRALKVFILISDASSILLVHDGISPHFRSLIRPGKPEPSTGSSGSACAW